MKKQRKETPKDASFPLYDVGMTRFELATTRPPDAYSTGLSYIPLLFSDGKVRNFFCYGQTFFVILLAE